MVNYECFYADAYRVHVISFIVTVHAEYINSDFLSYLVFLLLGKINNAYVSYDVIALQQCCTVFYIIRGQ